MAISQSYIDGLTRQVFIRDYILNGMFPCQSDIVKSIRSKKRNWEFNDRFEYRMLLATTNTGGTLNSQVFNSNVSLLNPNELTYGIFKATYGTVSDGFNVDMTVNLETDSARGSFITDYAMRTHSMRVNVAGLFKNFAINGRFGVVHKIMDTNEAESLTGTGSTTTPALGAPFRITAPRNVYASGFKTGRYLIKTTAGVPWGAANIGELYMILDNQPNWLWLVPVGQTTTAWEAGQYLEVFGNRTVLGVLPAMPWQSAPAGWAVFSDPRWGPAANALQIKQWNPGSADSGTFTYTTNATAGTGAMEGLSDLFPWYVDTTEAGAVRQGMDLPFRNQPNRQMFSTEQAGGFYVRQANESIIDAIMNGVALTTATVPYAECGVWMNPDTMLALGEQETQDVKWVKQIVSSAPLIFQRGVTSHDYQVGSKTIPATIQDYNMPTDVVVIGPRDDIGYNTWDNAMFKVDEYIQETFSSSEPPKPQELALPNDFVTKLDLSRRITYGSPVLGDHAITTEFQGGNFVHPSNKLPIAFHEMGALFTEAPFAYTVVHLRRQITNPSDVNNWAD